MGIQTSLDALRATTLIVDAMRAADELAFVASRNSGARTVRVLASALEDDDQLTTVAAVHALAGVFDDEADVVLTRLLSSDRPWLREHAAWAFGSRMPRYDAIGRLIAATVDGGFGGMLAQRTLQHWGSSAPEHVALALESALIGVREPAARYRLVETLGLVRGHIATSELLRIAGNPDEPEAARVAAVSGLGDRAGEASAVRLVTALSAEDGYLGDIARLALADLTASPTTDAPWQTGLTVAQMFLHADIDRELTRAGSGDNGGIATLLVRLGDALTADMDALNRTGASDVQRVVTLSRGSATDALRSLSEAGSTLRGHAFATVPLLSEPLASPEAWPLRVAAERGIRRVLRATGGVDAFHLRMADVGSLAAADVARDLDIPVVFTVAPDPHAIIHSLDLSGELTRENFGDVDARDHYWFRARLVQRLASDAAHTVLFPRPQLERDMRELVGIDITEHPERHTIVPEGIDLEVIDAAVVDAAENALGGAATEEFEGLADLLAELPEERRGLPLLLSVGRFNRVKGMATITEAWANGPLSDRANLLLVGGDLVNPSLEESTQLERIRAVRTPEGAAPAGLVLAGHRPNDVVARWLGATRYGLPGFAAPGGVYVCGSLKEEFGIAILEAMAAGLMVVAPAGGGPATYVEQGVTGFLTPTHDACLLGAAMTAALDAVTAETDDSRVVRSRDTVERDFTIQAMATALTSVYSRVAGTGLESAGQAVSAR